MSTTPKYMFLGFGICYPVTFGFSSDETGTSTEDVEQISAGGLRMRQTVSFVVEADTPAKAQAATMAILAHRKLYGTGRKFRFDWMQGLGISVPTTARATSAAHAQAVQTVAFNGSVQVGTYFQFAGFKPLYQVSEAATGSNRYRTDFPLVQAVPNNTVLDFTPTIDAKHHQSSTTTYGYNNSGFSIPLVTLIESR